VRWLFVSALLVLACKDPYDFQPGDPSKPDPPAAPVLSSPPDRYKGDNCSYPQNVEFQWRAVSGATFYQIEVFDDSTLKRLRASDDRVKGASVTLSFGGYGDYFWHVRAASPAWNNYTSWSVPFRFALPNPALARPGSRRQTPH
jgi:hypothetical protein